MGLKECKVNKRFYSGVLTESDPRNLTGYDYVTGFSEASALVTTWDKNLMYDQFKAVALEFYGKGFQVTNAPTSQPLGRTPWGGRLVETLGQDSYLNGIAFRIGAKAFADTGIVAGGKHFLLNEQEPTVRGPVTLVLPPTRVSLMIRHCMRHTYGEF